MSKNAKEIIRENALKRVENLDREVTLTDIIPIINGSTYTTATLFRLLFSLNNKIEITGTKKNVLTVSLNTSKIIVLKTQNNEWKVL